MLLEPFEIPEQCCGVLLGIDNIFREFAEKKIWKISKSIYKLGYH